MKNEKKALHKRQEKAEKNAGNNQWTNANLKYYPDKRVRRDGPSGD